MIKAKRSLGQNFLTSQKAIRQLAEAGRIGTDDIVLEIGPGTGALTRALLALGPQKVIAIEKDDALSEELRETFAAEIAAGKLEIHNRDFLELDLHQDLGLDHHRFKVAANIPYNITGLILRKLLETETQPSTVALLVQKEVAQRIASTDGKESLLSTSVKAFGRPKMIAKVPPGAFTPKPKVTSAIIAIYDISHERFSDQQEVKDFFQLVKAGYRYKRKTVANNLADFCSEKDQVNTWLETAVINPKTRAELLQVEDWLRLLEKGRELGILSS